MTRRVLFVGLGGVGQRHLRNTRAALGPDARLLAYRVRREKTLLSDKLEAIAGGDLEQEYGVDVVPSLEAALEEKPEVAIIANPTSLHVETTQKVLQAGCDVFVEKPLSHDLAGVQSLVEQAASLGRIGFVAYQLRFHPAVQALCAWIDEGKCGTLYGARAEVAEYLPAFHPYEDYRRMYASRRDLGGGVTLTQIHELDLLYRLFGVPQAAWSIGGKISDLEVDVEDSATSLLNYRRSDGKAFAVQLHQDYLGRPPRRSLSIWGSEGRIELDFRAGTLDFTRNDGRGTRLIDASNHPRNQLFVDELSHFLDCVESRKQPLVTLGDGAASLTMAHGLLESQRKGELVHFKAPNAKAA